MDELVPIEPAAMENRQVIEWDKDDVDILKFMKVDCLALGTLCIGFNLVRNHKGIALNLATIPAKDPLSQFGLPGQIRPVKKFATELRIGPPAGGATATATLL